MTSLHYSPLESARFGLRVFRAEVEALDAAAFAEEIEKERVDVAILRLPAHAISSVNRLREHDLSPIVADTIVRYAIDLSSRQPSQATDGAVTLHPASRNDAPLLENMARTIFADYISHYDANPLFARSRILDGYAQWASKHLDADDGSAAWLIESSGRLVGFSCYRLDEAVGTATGVLNGVLPDARGRGVYRGMVSAMLAAFAGMGMQRFDIATQVHNIAVQRVWTANRLSLVAASNTVHVNVPAAAGRIQKMHSSDI